MKKMRLLPFLLLILIGCVEKQEEALVIPDSQSTAVHWNREPLSPNVFAPLPLGSVKPRGWLKNQLRIQADGLTGHLDEFWPHLSPDSGWLGGSGESWERGPYYLDGLVPLAYQLEDKALMAKAEKWVDWTLENQRESGAIGPDPGKGTYAQEWQGTDWWPNMVMLKVLTQYQEATNDPRVIPLMTRYLRYHLEHADERPLVQWASFRWMEEVSSIVWLYNRTGDEDILELARKLREQAFDWNAHFADFDYSEKVLIEETEYPFRDTIRLSIHPAEPTTFPLHLRIPAWADGATITVAGQTTAGVRPATFHKVEREWRPGDTVEIVFPMKLVSERHWRDSIALRRGPIVFAMKIGEDWKKVGGEEPHADWEVHPTTPWNYGLVIDLGAPAESVTLEEKPIGNIPFSPDGAPLVLQAKARKIPGWKLENGSAAPMPQSPVSSEEPDETIPLIPYGSTNLRVTVFPLIAEKQ